MGKFDGKVAVITGGGKGGGIGYGLSTAFAKEGCDLVITGRNTRKLDDAREELERLYGVKVLACQADGGVEEQVAGVVKQAADTFGRIDFLINNAQNSASGGAVAVEHAAYKEQHRLDDEDQGGGYGKVEQDMLQRRQGLPPGCHKASSFRVLGFDLSSQRPVLPAAGRCTCPR